MGGGYRAAHPVKAPPRPMISASIMIIVTTHQHTS